MIRSMTGYGRDQQLLHGRSITVEIRSVNHRYFEFSCRAPRGCAFLVIASSAPCKAPFPAAR